MPQRPIPRTAKFSNLGKSIGQQQRLQWSTFVEAVLPEDEHVRYSRSLNRPREARDMTPGAYLWLPDPYQYEPLHNDYRAIRLIEVLPGPEDSIIKCVMHHAMLESTYTCLSFMSNPDSIADNVEDFFISVDKKRLQVSQALWTFLHFARSRRITDRIWIDEICINSRDLDEKSQQVSLIPWIYRSAASTIAWLENPSLATNTSVPDLSILGYAAAMAQENKTLDSSWLLSKTFAMQVFLFLPYWWRLQTAQEIILSHKIRFLTFTDECNLSAIYTLLAGLTKVQKEFPDLYHAMLCSPVFTLLSIVRKAYNKTQKIANTSSVASIGLPMHYLMQALKFHDCIEPRDRVYAVLGLAHKGDIFEVDYRESVLDLIRRSWENFRPKKRSMAKLLFSDLVETMQLDESMLPFYLASQRTYSPIASEAQRIDQPFSAERSTLEICEKTDCIDNDPTSWAYGINATNARMKKTQATPCHRRSKCCNNSTNGNSNTCRGRPRYMIWQQDPTLPLGLISCWQV